MSAAKFWYCVLLFIQTTLGTCHLVLVWCYNISVRFSFLFSVVTFFLFPEKLSWKTQCYWWNCWLVMILMSGVTHSEWNEFLKRGRLLRGNHESWEWGAQLSCTSQKGGGRGDRTHTQMGQKLLPLLLQNKNTSQNILPVTAAWWRLWLNEIQIHYTSTDWSQSRESAAAEESED